MNRRNEARKRWRRILERYRGSGLTIVAFCRQEGIPQSSFFAWQRKLRDEAVTSPCGLRDSISRDSCPEPATSPRASEGVITHEAHEGATLPHSSQGRSGFAEVKLSPTVVNRASQDSSNTKANGIPRTTPSDIHSQPSGVELRLPGYGSITVRRGFDRQTLIELLDVLESRSNDLHPDMIDGSALIHDHARTTTRSANA